MIAPRKVACPTPDPKLQLPTPAKQAMMPKGYAEQVVAQARSKAAAEEEQREAARQRRAAELAASKTEEDVRASAEARRRAYEDMMNDVRVNYHTGFAFCAETTAGGFIVSSERLLREDRSLPLAFRPAFLQPSIPEQDFAYMEVEVEQGGGLAMMVGVTRECEVFDDTQHAAAEGWSFSVFDASLWHDDDEITGLPFRLKALGTVTQNQRFRL
jgi:hypothetical protein